MLDDRGSFAATYALQQRLGDGGTAVVHAAVHRETGELVACKLGQRRRSSTRWSRTQQVFAHESEMLRRCAHPHIVQWLGLFHGPGEIALVLEHVGGGDIQMLLERHGCLAEHAVRAILTQIVSALQHVHACGVLHRDVKLENILVERPGAAPQVKLCDFGHSAIASDACDGFTGTTGYAAPEVRGSEPQWTAAADVFSTGTVAYAMLANVLPSFGRDGADLTTRAFAQCSLTVRLLIKSLLLVRAADRATLAHAAAVLTSPADEDDGRTHVSGGGTMRRSLQHSQRSFSLLDIASLGGGALGGGAPAAVPRASLLETRLTTGDLSASESELSFSSLHAHHAESADVSFSSLYAHHAESDHQGAPTSLEALAGTLGGGIGGGIGDGGIGGGGAAGGGTAVFECCKQPWQPWRAACTRLVLVGDSDVSTVDPSSGRTTNRWPLHSLLSAIDDGARGGAPPSSGSGVSLLLDEGLCCGMLVRRVRLTPVRHGLSASLAVALNAAIARASHRHHRPPAVASHAPGGTPTRLLGAPGGEVSVPPRPPLPRPPLPPPPPHATPADLAVELRAAAPHGRMMRSSCSANHLVGLTSNTGAPLQLGEAAGRKGGDVGRQQHEQIERMRARLLAMNIPTA